MTGLEKFFSTEGFFSVGDSFAWRGDLLWALALSDILLGLSFVAIALTLYFLFRRIKMRASGLVLTFAAFVVLLGMTHLASAILLWEPVFWLSSVLKILTAALAMVTALWVVQVWPQIVDFGIMTRKFEAYHHRLEKRHRLALFSNQDFEKLLTRSVFLPIALTLVLVVVFTAQITYIVNVKGEVADATKRISQMHALMRNFVDAESALRGYLLTGRSSYLQPLIESKIKTPRLLNELLARTEQHTLVHDNLEKLARQYIEWVDIANPLIERRARQLPFRDARVESYHNKLMEEARSLFSESIRLTVNERDTFSENADQATRLFILVSVSLSGLIGVLLALWSRKQILTLARNYSRALETAHELNLNLERRVSERTTALADANQALASANNELEAFSYSVSHDLRGPLRGIDGFSQILLEDYNELFDAKGKNYLGFIRDGVNKMGQLIDDLLNLSRLSKVDMTLAAADASAIAAEIASKLQSQSPDRQVRVKIEPGLRVCADHNLLHVLMENLLNNAWKFTSKAQGAWIEVKALRQNGLSGFVIRDNGAGFDMNFSSKLFQAFQRLHSTKEYDGTGIGLALCKRIVLRHGGQIWATGRPGEGAEFFVLLPDNPKFEAKTEGPQDPPPTPERTSTARPPGGPTAEL